MIKRIGFVIAVFVIGVVVLVSAVLHSAFLMQRVLKFMLQKNLPGYSVNELTIGRQSWIFPGHLWMADVSIDLASSKAQWSVQIPNVYLQDAHRFFFSSGKINLSAEMITVVGTDVLIDGANVRGEVNLIKRSLNTWKADIEVLHLKVLNYQLANVFSHMDGNKEFIHINHLKAGFCEGNIDAQIKIQLQKPIRYQSRIHLADINLQLLKGVVDVVYQNVQGIMDSKLELQGQENQLQSVTIRANIHKDAQIRASLLQFFVPYIPPTKDMEALRELMRKDLKVPVENAQLDLRSVDHQKLSGEIHLGIRKVNLDLNLPIDILFDGNLLTLVQWYRNLIQ